MLIISSSAASKVKLDRSLISMFAVKRDLSGMGFAKYKTIIGASPDKPVWVILAIIL